VVENIHNNSSADKAKIDSMLIATRRVSFFTLISIDIFASIILIFIILKKTISAVKKNLYFKFLFFKI